MRDFPGKASIVGNGIRALRRCLPRQDLTFYLGLQGGLGNQLFQIAGTYALASELGVGVVFAKSWPYRPYFSLPDEWFAGRLAVLRSRKAADHATAIPAELRGYFQDLALWNGREEEIRRLLQPSERALETARGRHGELLALPSKTAVHVRRGDYLGPEMDLQPCPVAYYEAAAELVLAESPDTHFLVFSDDLEWCRRELSLPGATFVEGNPDWLDLTLMTCCEHHICANSTFSWWGAFLSADPRPIVPWLVGTVPEELRRIHPAHWRELVLDP
ncbi:MAG TPA: alpha-1,2-fucosyltransferase [Gaiellaceae bacterium]|nr:alpha-1,2-fucosyltransferase [Gaiellaceae bacterium]